MRILTYTWFSSRKVFGYVLFTAPEKARFSKASNIVSSCGDKVWILVKYIYDSIRLKIAKKWTCCWFRAQKQTFVIATGPYAYFGVVGGIGPSGILRYYGEKIQEKKALPNQQGEGKMIIKSFSCPASLTILITSRMAKYLSVRSPASVNGAS